MKKSIILISALAIFTFYACQNNHSSENDEKNDNRQDTEVVENNNDEDKVEKNSEEQELSKERSNEEQIQFIKDEFGKIEGNENLKLTEYRHEIEKDFLTFYNLNIYSNKKGKVVKINYFDQTEGLEGSIEKTYYYNNKKLIFVYSVRLSASANMFFTYEDRYYFKNNKVIKHLEKINSEGVAYDEKGELQPINEAENNEYSSVDEEIQKKLTDWAYHFIEIQSDEDFAQWVEALYK